MAKNLLNMSKILIIGYQGMLGSDLVEAFKKDYKVIGMSRPHIDVTDKALCLKVIKKIKPDLVVNTVAYHKVQECHDNPDLSFLVNCSGASNVAHAAKAVGAKVVYISTDYVFDGEKISFSEFDKTNPLNIYGLSKLSGEIATTIANPSSYIIRTSWLFGIHQEHSSKGPNFVTQILSQAKSGQKIKVVIDQVGSPTYTVDLATKIMELYQKNAAFGIYHITNSGTCSWYEYANQILKVAKHKAKLEGINSESFVSEIKRPKNSTLKSQRLRKAHIKPLRKWQTALQEYIKINKLSKS
jgi:dTDP-4-dehydrorhamnose reductase